MKIGRTCHIRTRKDAVGIRELKLTIIKVEGGRGGDGDGGGLGMSACGPDL